MEEKKEYSEDDLEELFEKTTRHGAVLSLFHFDAHGEQEQSVRDLLVDLIARLSKEKGMLYCKGEVDEPLKPEGAEFFSTCAEVKILAESFPVLSTLAFKYTPVAVEILRPKEIRMPLDEAQTCLLDASQISQDYTNYLLKSVMKPEDLEKFEEKLKLHRETGASLVKKALESQKEKK